MASSRKLKHSTRAAVADEDEAMSMPVLSLRVSALSRALSSLTDTVMASKSLSGHATRGGALGTGSMTRRNNESEMEEVMTAVT